MSQHAPRSQRLQVNMLESKNNGGGVDSKPSEYLNLDVFWNSKS